jgi:hypothetical protein
MSRQAYRKVVKHVSGKIGVVKLRGMTGGWDKPFFTIIVFKHINR